MNREGQGKRGRLLVFDPSPFLTVTIEGRPDATSEIHVHAGGQAFWVSRMAAILGARVELCGVFGGESGPIAAHLMTSQDVKVREIKMTGGNGVRIYDRRDGDRQVLAETIPVPLSRHELDDLCNAALAAALDADVAVLCGTAWPDLVPADLYGRLAADLNALGLEVVADLTGEALTCALSGGLTALKVSHEELLQDGRAGSDDDASLKSAMQQLVKEGTRYVVVSRADEGALALVDDEVLEVNSPRLSAVDHRGAGDSMTAGIATGIAKGDDIREALRLGTAAGTLNVTRHGLATGDLEAIVRLVDRVTISPVSQSKAASEEDRS